jgi:hypothetical protein
MTFIDAVRLRIPVWSLTLISLDFPLTTLIGITGKRKQRFTCTQKTTRAKLDMVAKRLSLDMQGFRPD